MNQIEQSAPWWRLSKGILWLLIISTVVSVPFVQCVGDDTFIYMRIIDNFLDTGHFEYNHGEPSYCMTSLTWFLTWSGLTAVFQSHDIARYVLSLLSHLFAFFMILSLARRLIEDKRIIAVVLAAVVFDPFYQRWFWGGWEMSFKIAVAAMVILVLIGLRRDSPGKQFFLAGLAAAFGVLTRPEMIALAAYGLIYLTVMRPARRTSLVYYCAGIAVLLVPWFFYAYVTFGWIVPHTVFAKTDMHLDWDYFRLYGLRFFKILLIPQVVVLGLLVWAGIKRFFTRTVAEETAIHSGGGRIWLDFSFVLIWGGTAFGYLISGAYIASIKTGLFVPFLSLAAGILISQWSSGGKTSLRLSGRHAVLAAGIILLISLAVQTTLFYRYSIFNPRYRQGADRNLIDFALRVREATKPDDVIGLWELGVLGYYTDRYILDFFMLATPDLVRYKLAYQDDYIDRYLEDTGNVPDYIVRDYPKEFAEMPGFDFHYRGFWGNRYKALFWQKVNRISGAAESEDYSLYVLYVRDEAGDRLQPEGQ